MSEELETYEQRRNKQLRKEIEEADSERVRRQKLLDYLWEQKLLSGAPFDDGYDYSTGFKEPKYRPSCHVGKHDSDFGQH